MLKQKHIINALIVSTILLLFSCEETFKPDIDIKDYENMLVVDGLITNQPGPFKIRLSTSVPLDTIISEYPVSGATVIISDDHNNIYDLFYQGDGWYSTNQQDLQAQIGYNYVLNITTPDGMEYESSVVEMLKCPEIEKVHVRQTQRTSFSGVYPKPKDWVEILIDTKGDENHSKYIKWDYEDTWEVNIPNKVNVANMDGSLNEVEVEPNDELRHCWVSSQSQSIHVSTTEKQETNNVYNYVLKSMGPGDNKLHIKYSILIKQYSLSQELYNFWKKLEDYNENIGSMFDTTPSSIYGNISCCNSDKKVLGYFMASDVKIQRIFIDKTMHKVRTVTGYESCIYDYVKWEDYLFFGKTLEYHANLYHPAPKCIDCLNEGTNIKPPFWE